MCRQILCKECKKPTWAGCGQHVEEALAGVPRSARCVGHEKQSSTVPRRSWFRR
ncbi:hypothetical protein HMPREF0063_11524 [Aeromicrobium marinum DSM 15272]|uniref:Uncharacterized protein n=1 Tax=Aeromicrobium marinum DSM 15272 TaxID=585531 RepID=E2SBW5_9ACTN|nr:hypothetical protein [Aeromicrobium marinum]EFQ83251.1 hypothetical protein HMPREF0063_11524 [Aeromicrobium marinum DSM 15272]